jgi:hypothetical protein
VFGPDSGPINGAPLLERSDRDSRLANPSDRFFHTVPCRTVLTYKSDPDSSRDYHSGICVPSQGVYFDQGRWVAIAAGKDRFQL